MNKVDVDDFYKEIRRLAKEIEKKEREQNKEKEQKVTNHGKKTGRNDR